MSHDFNKPGPCTAVVGLQWGDEGKGKVVDLITPEFDAVVRYNGGANAGHSVVVAGERYALHLVPSGILYPGKLAVIGNGVVVDPDQLLKEMDGLAERGVDTSGLRLSDRAHVVLPYHKTEDELRELVLAKRRDAGAGVGEIGTTKRGIGPCYADKVLRALAVRVGDMRRPDVLRERIEISCEQRSTLFAALGVDHEPFDAGKIYDAALAAGRRLEPLITDTTYLLNEMIAGGSSLLFEGANATLLDVDHGTYPYVTSSNSSALGIGAGTGVSASKIGRVLGVMKAYSTRVGSGPFPTELSGGTGDRIRERGHEYGTTTGRPRRVGWLDLVAVRYSAMINGVTGLAITLLDVLAGFDELRVCTEYEIDGTRTGRFIPDAADLERAVPVYTTLPGFLGEIDNATVGNDLPDEAKRYVSLIEEHVGVPADFVSVGPDRAQTVVGSPA